MGVKILSLYDGMACGMIAMQLAGVEVESYDAYEIDKYAIKTAQHNFPDIKEHGDVFDADFTQYEGVDFLIGGSPCTYWSIAQTKNRETVASGMGWELFSQYVRALHEAKPKYFIYENNKSMSKDIRASIDDTFGFEAVLINSALVSAQNRQRLYWVGKRNEDGTYSKVNVEQPADRGILLKDVLDSAVAMREKAHTIDANYYKGGNFTSPNKQSGKRLMAAEPINADANEKAFCVTARYYKGFGNNQGKCLEKHRDSMVAEPLVTTKNGKSFAITANYVHIQDYPNDYAAHTIEKSVKPLVAEPINVTASGKAKTISASYDYKGDGEGSLKSELFPDNPIKQTSNYVAEPMCLRYERTEEAKRCRKAYEAHEIKHGYNELNELHPRPDGKTNTLTTVLKDNQIMEPVCVAERGRMYCGQPQHYEARTDGKTNTLTSVEKDNRVAEPVKVGYVGNGGQGNRVYSINGKAVAQTAQSGGMGSNTGLYAEPINVTADGKVQCLRATCYKDGIRNIIANEVDKKTGVAEPINDILQVGAMPRPDGEISTSAGFRIYSTEAKGRYLCANGGGADAKTRLYAIPYAIEFDDDGRPIKAIGKDGKEITIYEVKDGKITIKGKQYPIKLKDGYYIIRKLTVRECMRLQTVPEWYEFPVSNSQAYKMLGNGWTCEVIAHLIRSCMCI